MLTSKEAKGPFLFKGRKKIEMGVARAFAPFDTSIESSSKERR